MRRAIPILAVLLLVAGAAVGSWWLAHSGQPGRIVKTAVAGPSPTMASKPPLYYQDPDGKPFYGAGPKKAADGRDYVPIYDDQAPPQATSREPAQTVTAGSPSSRGRVLYYRNPMGLPDTSPNPKKDSMGMDYIPVYENEAAYAGAGIVTVPPGRLQVLGVRTAAVETRSALTRTVRATGVLQFDERHLAVVTTRVSGWIERLEVAATGDAVRHGQVLAEIYSPDLVASEEEYLVAARMGAAPGPESLTAASLQRLRALQVPVVEIARLQRTGQASRRVAVMAPQDGVVIEKAAVEGMRVSIDQALYKTANLSQMWLIAEVQEQDLGAIRPGEQVRASLVAFPGRSFAGSVDFIYPSLTAETRTGRVRVVMPNPDLVLRAGMYAEAEIEAPAGTASGPVLAVPALAVIDSGTQQVVLVELGQGRFEPRKVRLGAQGDGYAQILDGVKAGERVVVGANFLIDAESNLRAALQSFTAPQAKDDRGKAGDAR